MAQVEDKCDESIPQRRPLKSAGTLEPHICRKCFGRVISYELATAGGDGRTKLFECTNCGEKATGRDASVLCCCGIKIRSTSENGKPTNDYVDAGIRCHENEAPTPEFPAKIVASYQGESA